MISNKLQKFSMEEEDNNNFNFFQLLLLLSLPAIVYLNVGSFINSKNNSIKGIVTPIKIILSQCNK